MLSATQPFLAHPFDDDKLKEECGIYGVIGLADAATLARVIHEREFWREVGDFKLLRRYERARQAEVGAMGWLTDGLFGLFNQTDSRVQALRNWGMSGVDRLGPLKHWLARQAMGHAG